MARVLHIEDDPANRRLVNKLLGAAGHEIVEAETGLEGIRCAAECQPDLVLVDINIPDLDGYEVTLRLRGIADLAKTPIVAITAEGDRDTSLAVGCDGFIAKPIDARGFARRIDRYLRGHRELGDGGKGEKSLRSASQRIVERLEAHARELSQANDRLEEMARLRREFLRNVTHELATPLTPIVGYVNLLLSGNLGPLDPRQERALAAVSNATDRLRGVVDLLLDVSALETKRMSFQHRSYDLLVVVRESLEEVRELARAREVEILEEPAAPTQPCIGDPDRLRRALVHILSNACAFSPGGGVVPVAVRPLAQAGAGGESGPDGYAILVGDDGPGLRPEHIGRVFEPFFQVDGSTTRQHEGVGLGLAFALRVAEAHGGTVRMESPPARELAGHRPKGTVAIMMVARRPRAEG